MGHTYSKTSWLVKTGEFLSDYWPQVITFFGGGVIAFQQCMGDRLLDDASLVLFVTGECLIASGLIWGLLKRKSLSQLERDRAELEIHVEYLQNVVSDQTRFYLMKLAKDLKLNETERISLYHHVGQHFVPFGRYSASLAYDRPGRDEYPDDQGCIGKAWAGDDHFVNDLPDPDAEPERYAARLHVDYLIPPDVAERLTMKSRTYAVLAFRDLGDAHKIGLVVIESLRCDGIDFVRIKDILGKRERKRVSQLCEITQYQKTVTSKIYRKEF